jgi:hypothetical protein
MKKGQGEGVRLVCGRRAEKSWEGKCEERVEVKVGNSVGFILKVGHAPLSFEAAAWPKGARAAGESEAQISRSRPAVSCCGITDINNTIVSDYLSSKFAHIDNKEPSSHLLNSQRH